MSKHLELELCSRMNLPWRKKRPNVATGLDPMLDSIMMAKSRREMCGRPLGSKWGSSPCARVKGHHGDCWSRDQIERWSAQSAKRRAA